MLQIRRILHPTDFSEAAHAAFRHAIHLARAHDAMLDVLHVSHPFGEDPIRGAYAVSLDEDAFYKEKATEADRQMQAYVGAHSDPGVAVKGIHSRSPGPADAILEYADLEQIDLIVMGTQARRGVRTFLLGSVAEAVVRRAECPVFTIHEQATPTEEAVRHVLAPIDFSTHAVEALGYAKELAALYGAHLHLLHVVQVTHYPSFYSHSVMRVSLLEQDLEAEARRELEQLYAQADGPPGPVSFHVCSGYPPHEILNFARKQAIDLVVMASHGLTGFKHFLFGSVTEKVVQLAPCPVFTVRSFGKSLLPASKKTMRPDEVPQD